MALGRKRLWAGSGLISLSLVIVVMLAVSRSHSYNHLSTSLFLTIDQGAVCLSPGRPLDSNFASFQEDLGGLRRSKSEPNLQWWIPDPNAFDSPGNPGLGVFVRPTGFLGYSKITDSNGVDHYVVLLFLLWPLVLAAFVPGAALVVMGRRVARRTRLGHCPACNYNLSGLAAGAACPECGTRARSASKGEAG